MKYYTLLYGAIFLLASTQSLAETKSEWINIAESSSDGSKWDMKAGSFEFSKTKGGTAIAVVVGRVVNKKSTEISLYKWYVSAEDCKNKMGKVVSLGVDGEFKFENEFVFDSGNISSAMAEGVCSVADYLIKEANDKSL